MERWIAYVLKANPDRVWRNGRGSDWGDWLAIDSKPGDKPTPKDLIGTAFWAYSTSLMADMAQATGRTEECKYYKQLAIEITAAFRKAYVRADGEVGSGSQTSTILPLAFGLLPEELRSAAANKLAANIRAHGTKLSTGFLGTPYILDALASHGHEDLAVELLLQTGYPSWGYMVMKGATTMWERWNSDTGDIAMNSYNHYAFGAIAAFLYRRIAGIDQTAPGFEQILIRPICDPRLKFAAGDYETAYGRISTEWRRDAMGLQLSVTLPPNTHAVIQIPASTSQTVRENGRPIRPRDGLSILARDNRIVAVSAGSGSYRFSVV
jgi:alpha-L-rhamnosidase